MPRQYIRPDQFLNHPLASNGGWSFNGVGTLMPGQLEGMIARASARVDRACKRRFGMPGSTNLAEDVLAGATTIKVDSLINLDDPPAMLFQIGAAGSGTQETVQIGTTSVVGTYALPIPGAATLYNGTALQYAHSAGEPVVGYWFEQSNLKGGATSATDQYWDLTQEGQIAMGHAPRMGLGQIVRTVFLRAYPIQSILSVQVTYPWANSIDPGVVSDLFVVYAEGWYRFPVGYFVPNDSVVWTAYRAGYDTIPDDIQEAVLYEVASELAMARNPLGAMSIGSGVRHVSWGGKRSNLFSDVAAEICRNNRNLSLG